MEVAISKKRILIDKANARIVAVVSIAAALVVLGVVSSKVLISQAAYQNRIITKKKQAVTTLKADIEQVKKLQVSYDDFVNLQKNIIGGNRSGLAENDGENSKIILDALPSQYNFPELTTNLEALVGTQNAKLTSVSGTDDEVAQGGNRLSATPKPVTMPFQFTVSDSYEKVQAVTGALERSIRPIQVKTVDLSGTQNTMVLSVTAQTYFQPAKTLNVGKVVVK